MGGFSTNFGMKTVNRDDILVSGAFRPNAGTGVVTSSEKGEGFSVARTSAGLYTVTLANRLPADARIMAGIRAADAYGSIAQVGDYVEASKTFQIRILQAGAGLRDIPIDITAAREIVSNDIGVLIADETGGVTSGGGLASDSAPFLARVNGATDKALRIGWASSNSTELALPTIMLPDDLDDASDINVYLIAGMAGATDTPTIDVQAFFGVSDTECGGATAALGATRALVNATIAAADVPSAVIGRVLNLSLVPGAHTTDILYLYGARMQYTSTGEFALKDLAADADNEVVFSVVARNTD